MPHLEGAKDTKGQRIKEFTFLIFSLAVCKLDLIKLTGKAIREKLTRRNFHEHLTRTSL
jgi:hypothetical protein